MDRGQVLRRHPGASTRPATSRCTARYLQEKLELTYPVNDNLRQLLELIIADPRWDVTYLGMQILVEGIALAAFGLVHQFTTEPLMKQLTRYVMADEARHVAFGALSLAGVYDEMRDGRAPGS